MRMSLKSAKCIELQPLCWRSGNSATLFAVFSNDLHNKETPLSKIARRKFIQLSAVAAAGLIVKPSRDAHASDLPQLSEDDPMAKAMKYTHDASTVDPSSRNNPAPDQKCSNCALVQGAEGDAWVPCQIFPGKAVAANGWCSVWAPKP